MATTSNAPLATVQAMSRPSGICRRRHRVLSGSASLRSAAQTACGPFPPADAVGDGRTARRHPCRHAARRSVACLWSLRSGSCLFRLNFAPISCGGRNSPVCFRRRVAALPWRVASPFRPRRGRRGKKERRVSRVSGNAPVGRSHSLCCRQRHPGNFGHPFHVWLEQTPGRLSIRQDSKPESLPASLLSLWLRCFLSFRLPIFQAVLPSVLLSGWKASRASSQLSGQTAFLLAI
jgi:hypothetical protein